MATKELYENHKWVLDALSKCQESDHDRRTMAREAHTFVDKRGGQWEEWWEEVNKDSPKYTFDMSTSLIDLIHGQMERTDFDIKVRPSGGSATKGTAQTYDGLVRNVENISDAGQVYDHAGLEVVTCGVSGWEVVQEYVDGDSFDQDLVIKAIPDYLDSTWLGTHKKRDGSDARYGFILRGLSPDEFKRQYPDRDVGAGVGSDRESNTYYHRQDVVMVGEFRYLLPKSRELVLMDNGQVLEVDDKFKAVYDDLTNLGINEVDRRSRTVLEMKSRLFDANGWINKKPRDTKFRHWLNIIPCYANFKYVENKVIYWGVVEKLIDPQRVLNYTLSREVAETSLAPKDFFWATDEQEEGQDWSDLNVSQKPVQNYTYDENAPGPPIRSGGAQVSPGLARLTDTMNNMFGSFVGMFHASQGDNPNAQSGVAIEALQDKGDQGNNKYMTAREVAQRHTGRILVDAIPRVYKPGRQVRILSEDGSFDMAVIGQQVRDAETGNMVTLNDLSEGSYDVYCTVGPSFKSRQSETVGAMTALGQYVPEVITTGADVLLNNIDAPGIDQVKDRVRAQLFQSGAIPIEQMTDEEKAKLEQMKMQPPQESPDMVAARGMEAEGNAKQISAQTERAKVAADIQDKEDGRKIDAFNAETKRIEVLASVKSKDVETDLKLYERIAQTAGGVSQNGVQQ